MNALSSDLRSGIVRVLDLEDETTVGTGFLVSEQFVLTCAHVVGYAKASPGDEVSLVLLVNGCPLTAIVEEEYWRDAEEEDVAILRLQDPLPTEANPLPLGTSRNIKGHEVSTFGFPKLKPLAGMPGTGTVDGELEDENHYSLIQLTSTQMTEGFSGAPVLDEQTHCVVGMVTSRTPPEIDNNGQPTGRLTQTAFITPSQVLREICPLLKFQDICPYQGLSAFTEENAEFFHGREELVETMMGSLRRHPSFLAVVGLSGSGKSSVVQAGLIPKLRRGEVLGFKSPQILTFRPSDRGSPQEAAIQAFEQISVAITRAEMWEQIQDYLQQQETRTVLYIDQFEELFALYPSAAKDFTQGLYDLLQLGLPVTLMISIRSDFYGFLQESALGELLKDGMVDVLGMSEANLKAAICEPAKEVGLGVENGLADRIVADLKEKDTKNPLPLLEFTLKQLSEAKREQNLLTSNCYGSQKVGGVTGAIAQWAKQTYSHLNETEKSLGRQILTRLIHYGTTDTPNTRRRLPIVELITRPDRDAAIRQVVKKLADARLLVTEKETAEIIHDALIVEWPELGDWIEREGVFLRWRQRLDESLDVWNANEKREGNLLYAAPLAEAEGYLNERGDELNLEECRYIEASLEKRDRLAREEKERQQREYQLLQERMKQEKKTRRRTQIAAGLASIAVMLGGLGWRAQQQSERDTLIRDAVLQVATPETVKKLAQRLPSYLKLAEKAEGAGNIEKALTDYRFLVSLNLLEARITRNPEEFANLTQERETIQNIAAQAENSLARAIRQHKLPQLEAELKKGDFGQLKQLDSSSSDSPEFGDFSQFEEQYTGALRTTYALLMRESGAHADINNDGYLTEGEEELLPCQLLEEVDSLWRKFTENRCGWYGATDFFEDPDCRELDGNTLTYKVNFLPSIYLMEKRLVEQCEIVSVSQSGSTPP